MPTLGELFEDEEYILFLFPYTPDMMTKWHACILLKKECKVFTHIKAWVHALIAARILMGCALDGDGIADVITVLERSLNFLNGGERFEKYGVVLERRGWDLQTGALETKAGRRIEVV